MKQLDKIIAFRISRATIICSFAFLVYSLLPSLLYAQEDSVAVEEESSLVSPSIEFGSVQKGDNTITLKASMRAKINGALIKLWGLKLSFYSVSDSGEVKLGDAVTDRNGTAVLAAKEVELNPDEEGRVHFKVAYAGNKTLEAAEEILAVKRAKLILTPIKEDSLFSVQLKLVDISTGEETPVPELNLSVYVQRTFSLLKLGEGASDELGEALVEIPVNLPGDSNGSITLLAKLDESDEYGVVEASVMQPWGVVVSDANQKLPRALWSTNPPIWMLVTFIVLMVVVWGHYIVIFFELFRLRKEH